VSLHFIKDASITNEDNEGVTRRWQSHLEEPGDNPNCKISLHLFKGHFSIVLAGYAVRQYQTRETGVLGRASSVVDQPKVGEKLKVGLRKRVLRKTAEDLKLPKLTFQVIRRTIATLAQKEGNGEGRSAVLRHSRTTDVYMQEIPESVRTTVNAINAELRKKAKSTRGKQTSSDLLPSPKGG